MRYDRCIPKHRYGEKRLQLVGRADKAIDRFSRRVGYRHQPMVPAVLAVAFLLILMKGGQTSSFGSGM